MPQYRPSPQNRPAPPPPTFQSRGAPAQPAQQAQLPGPARQAQPAGPARQPQPPSPPPEPERKTVTAPELSVNKVVAGAGAAATSAVAGSLFGAFGTVAGAAIGSVVSMVGATLYQRSLDRTRDTVARRIKVVGGKTVDRGSDATVPMQRMSADGGTPRQREFASPTVRSGLPRKRIAALAGVAVLIFVVAMLAVTGLEWVKGSTLSGGQSGTSVGRVLDGGAAQPTAPSDSEDTGGTTSTRESTREPSTGSTSQNDPTPRSTTRSTPPTTGGSDPTGNSGGLVDQLPTQAPNGGG